MRGRIQARTQSCEDTSSLHLVTEMQEFNANYENQYEQEYTNGDNDPV